MEIKQIRKTNRKIKHCEGILLKYENIKPSPIPTNVIFVGNGGLGCSIQRELLLDEFSLYGPLQNVVMLPGKPYAFIVYKYKEDAIRGMNAINGQKLMSGHVFYLSYICESDLPKEGYNTDSWPSGLILLENFITEDEEKELLQAINFEESADGMVLKHRRVKHYGYEFIYGKNNIDKNKSLDLKIPDVCYPHLQKLVSDGYIPRIPEQLTVNHYLPGQGIPPHIDTHSAFEDCIISLSLGSQVVMDFYHPTKKSIPVLIPRRSVLIMTGESRYLWKHGITPRKTDIIPVKSGEGISLNLCNRSPRTSLTFRRIRSGECNCDYIEQCDSQMKSKSHDLVDEEEAKELEKKYVNQVYENIADHFSDTRYKPWPKVSSFLSTVPPGSLILDIGCGNGKNMGLSHQCFESRRAKALNEIIRVLVPGGKALIYVWAFEQGGPEGPSNYLKSSKQLNENKIIPSTEIQLNESTSLPKTIKMPVDKNRTNFIQQDMLVPWKEKKLACQNISNDTENPVLQPYQCGSSTSKWNIRTNQC